MIERALKRGPILDKNSREILANPSLVCGRNFPIPLWESIVSFNCINVQILIYIEGAEKEASPLVISVMKGNRKVLMLPIFSTLDELYINGSGARD